MNSLRKFDKSEIVAILEKFFTHRSFLSLSRKWKLIVIDEVADLIMQLIDMQQEEIERLNKRIEELEAQTKPLVVDSYTDAWLLKQIEKVEEGSK